MEKDSAICLDMVQIETDNVISATATPIRDRASSSPLSPVENIIETVETMRLFHDTIRGEEENDVPINEDDNEVRNLKFFKGIFLHRYL